LSQQQQFLISAIIQFVSYTQQIFDTSTMSTSLKSFSQKSSSADMSSISFMSTPSAVVQQLILYMSVSSLKSAEASHFNETNVTDFLEA